MALTTAVAAVEPKLAAPNDLIHASLSSRLAQLDDMEAELAALADMSLADLRNRWQAITDKPVPRVRRTLLHLALAWELQVTLYGGLPRRTEQRLAYLSGKDIPDQAATPRMHEAIVGINLWEAVQSQLAGKVRGIRRDDSSGGSVLAGRIIDEAGEPLIAAHARKGERRYRYYVSKALHERGRDNAVGAMRIPASEVEQVVAQECAALLKDPLRLVSEAALELAPTNVGPLLARCTAMATELDEGRHGLLTSIIHRVRVGTGAIDVEVALSGLAGALQLSTSGASPAFIIRRSGVRRTRTGRAVRLVHDNGAAATADGVDLTLIRLIVQARGWWQRLSEQCPDPSTIAAEEGVSVSYIVRVLRLAFLSPTVIEAVLNGRLRAGVDSTALLDIRAIAPSWEEQERRCMLRK